MLLLRGGAEDVLAEEAERDDASIEEIAQVETAQRPLELIGRLPEAESLVFLGPRADQVKALTDLRGMRIGIGLSWLAIVAAEMLIGGVGIGFFIWDSWNSSRISDIILALIYVGIIGFMLDRVIALAARLVTRGTASN